MKSKIPEVIAPEKSESKIAMMLSPARVEPKFQPRLLAIKDAAAVLGVSVWTVRQWAYSGKIASNKLGVKLMVPIEELDRIVAESSRPRVG